MPQQFLHSQPKFKIFKKTLTALFCGRSAVVVFPFTCYLHFPVAAFLQTPCDYGHRSRYSLVKLHLERKFVIVLLWLLLCRCCLIDTILQSTSCRYCRAGTLLQTYCCWGSAKELLRNSSADFLLLRFYFFFLLRTLYSGHATVDGSVAGPPLWRLHCWRCRMLGTLLIISPTNTKLCFLRHTEAVSKIFFCSLSSSNTWEEDFSSIFLCLSKNST